jgi:hypothetical protein
VDEARLAQHLEMLAHGGLADAEQAGEVAGAGTALLREAQGDPQPNGVAERLQLRSGIHLTNYIVEI